MLGLVFAVAIVLDAALIVVSYLYSRFVFSGYLRKHHTKRWEEMVYGQEYRGLNMLAFDKTPALWRFRCESHDDLGDPRIPRMRRLSIYLFNTAMIAWLSIAGVILVGGVVFMFLLR
jgi:disulfide bond formation protein DsbB